MKIENVDELRLLVSCAEGGNLSSAAQMLQVTPAAASAMLRRLEARVGARLFERTTRSMRATPAGAVLAGYAARALELLEEGSAQIGEDTQRLHGTVRVTSSSDLTRHVLLPWLDAFLQAHPGVEINLSVSDTLQDVVKDHVDVALRYGELSDSRLVARKLMDVRRIACAAPGYLSRHGAPQHPQELSGHDCITFRLRGQRNAVWHFSRPDGSEPVELRVNGRRQCDDGEIARRWAVAGHGVASKAELDVLADLESRALVRLFPDFVGESIPLHAVLPSNRFIPARVRALVEHLAACCASVQPRLQASGSTLRAGRATSVLRSP
ncbi:LysR family transcriptional regulator [Schlegelella sp. S2-27]|uniref:LysR family transcriptional regulator n=1 Tax=Caldimonas mangrovi TaxID=2944811 RepID=A0ABT0YPY7_9BURK|nr:LysR family transcriptional regulator [Caldimonas mangrovi]MCM5680728.1 LysR family transcriptional regulator [Caldimonas mangrovi]